MLHILFRSYVISCQLFTNGPNEDTLWGNNHATARFDAAPDYPPWINGTFACGWEYLGGNKIRVYQDPLSWIWTCDGFTNLFKQSDSTGKWPDRCFFEEQAGVTDGKLPGTGQAWKSVRIISRPASQYPPIVCGYTPIQGNLILPQPQWFNYPTATNDDAPVGSFATCGGKLWVRELTQWSTNAWIQK